MLFTQKFSKGSVIFNKGDEGDVAYIIDKGAVEIYIEEDSSFTPICILGPGEIFGEMAVIDTLPRSASARAAEDCNLTIVSKEQLSERVGEADPIVRLLLNMLMDRLRRDIDKARKKSGDVSHQGHSSSVPISMEGRKVIKKIKFERELYEALTKNEFEVYFQPVIHMQKGLPSGVEALIRWNSPSRGLVRPDVFMGVAEETSLIVPIGQWVLKQAFKEFSQMLESAGDKFTPQPFLSVNVSVRQFNDAQFFKILEDSLEQYKLDPKQIKLEITERLLLEGPAAYAWVERCKKLGVSVAIDDFGTGYTSLRSLDTINVDYLKIDKSFIDKVYENENTAVIVKALVDMCQGLGLKTVAEGIETQDQFEKIKGFNIDLAQGYYFSKPLPIDKLMEYFVNQGVAAA